ncbi:branched-chain-amino-acid transaminase [Paucibacter sp. AS339]|uniref:branched-chain-amino-acid transaminase n=1 Tax=Paucibacter hankyongi TaxID=3133434 RepID=UPI0030982057
MVDNLIWIRGEIIRQSQATVNVLSPMAQFGLNVFEGIRCYWNEENGELYAFRLKEHLDRLMLSCRLVRLPAPYNPGQIEAFMRAAIQANDFQTDTAVRMTIFGDGQGTWNTCEPVSMFIAPMAKRRTQLEKVPALKACISSWERINDNVLPPRAKVGANYINGRYAHLQARHDGYDLPIFLGQDRKVAEGAGACLFMVRNGELITPPTTSSVLESITRDTIMVLARDSGIPVVERTIDRTELYLADEIFLCGSAAEISPIVSVDGYVLGKGQPGPITLSMLHAYLAVSSGENPDHPEWRTLVHRRP